jgi:lipopolysaccharide transport system permease protein
MSGFPISPTEMVGCLWRNKALIHVFVKREVAGRYRGSMLGLLWSLINPLFMLLVYTFVFSAVFKAQWSADGNSTSEFALILFAGLIVFNLFSECVTRAPSLILANVNYVKKVVFPLEILPLVSLLAASYQAFVSLIVWLTVYIILLGVPHITVLLLPLVIIPYFFLIMGFSWILASLGVFLRDVAQFVGLVIATLMFLSPIFYPVTAVPEGYRHLLLLNPLTPTIEMTRGVLLWGETPDALVLAGYWLITSFIAWLGFVWFQRTRSGFADVS